MVVFTYIVEAEDLGKFRNIEVSWKYRWNIQTIYFLNLQVIRVCVR